MAFILGPPPNQGKWEPSPDWQIWFTNIYNAINNLSAFNTVPSFISSWNPGTYINGNMVKQANFYYVCNKDGTATEPRTDFYQYNPLVPYNPGTKGWTRYDSFGLGAWTMMCRNLFGAA